jgi:hypothetical protein
VPFHALHELNGLVAEQILHGEQGYPRSVRKAWRWLYGVSQSRGEVSA